MDKEVWHASVFGVARSQTQLTELNLVVEDLLGTNFICIECFLMLSTNILKGEDLDVTNFVCIECP